MTKRIKQMIAADVFDVGCVLLGLVTSITAWIVLDRLLSVFR